MKRPTLLRIILLSAILLVAGCATTPAMVSDRLFFGRAIPSGGEVSEAQWAAFRKEVIEPRFPNGFTVYRGEGFWRGDDGASVSEQTCILEVTHNGDATAKAKVAEIAQAYRERFSQDAVLQISTPITQTFWRRTSPDQAGLKAPAK